MLRQRVVFMMTLGLINCGRAGFFRSVPGVLIHLKAEQVSWAEALWQRKTGVACLQETRWRGSGCRLFGAIGKRYKLFWMASED